MVAMRHCAAGCNTVTSSGSCLPRERHCVLTELARDSCWAKGVAQLPHSVAINGSIDHPGAVGIRPSLIRKHHQLVGTFPVLACDLAQRCVTVRGLQF